ncbi:MAG: cob(I)yrinic acid a,c-diamide adenosyltransferase [Kiritimatiellota bacterium]|nr:cob(I)yrinic acid a,c-diamide adenosyltransferase [Kiritimatiellota bacterium]
MKPTPRILLFTGDGKGKTTAALGMAIRALGHNLPTLIIQFIKCDDSTGDGRSTSNGRSTGEYSVFRRLLGVEIRPSGLGFVPPRSAPQFANHQRVAHRALDAAAQALAAGKYRVVILDEICTAVAKNLLTEEAVIRTVKQAPIDAIVVLTGRGASQKLIDLADTVTEMRCVKHAYQQGRKAQKGVEF